MEPIKRIHEDIDLDHEDKFQYLLQSTIPDSRVGQLVESYPPSSENYPKVIDSLTARFGGKDFLAEVYVRRLLKLILNSITNKEIPIVFYTISLSLRSDRWKL